MKKFFTLMVSISIAVGSFAQPDRKKEEATIIKAKGLDTHRTDLYTFSTSKKQAAIAKINHEYYLKITAIQKEHISKVKMSKLIKKAKAERDQQLKAVNERFNSKYNSALASKSQYDKH